jgi:lipoate-protein ligase B
MNSRATAAAAPQVIDLGVMGYKQAWDEQLKVHQQVLEGKLPAGAILFVQHPPVITIGRRPGAQDHLLVPEALLRQQGVEVVATDRGGDITFHGPGQLVVYPVLPLNYYGLGIHRYLRLLEQAVIDTLADLGLAGFRDACATGVWTGSAAHAEKVCAIGIKLKRWISLHGAAVNVSTDLRYFAMINPCGLSRPVTSIEKLLGRAVPMATVQAATAKHLLAHLVALHSPVALGEAEAI